MPSSTRVEETRVGPLTAVGSDADVAWPIKTVDRWEDVAPAAFDRIVVPGKAHLAVMNDEDTVMPGVFLRLKGDAGVA